MLDEIGQGGMGRVYKAQDRAMQRTVALKVLASRLTASPEATARFRQEVRAAARLQHPQIVTAYDAGEDRGLHYLVMEFVEGQDLGRLVRDHGPLSVEQAVDYAIQAAQALSYAHDQGVVHRDLKPGNLLVDSHGVVKLLDLGLARVEQPLDADHAATGRLTVQGQVLGTADYMAPEQAWDIRSADQRADIYSLGCTLYRLLTGHAPYRGDTLMRILLAHREAPIPSVRAARPEVPPELDAALQRMLAKRPEQRPQSMTQVVEQLQACQRGTKSSPTRKFTRASGGRGRRLRAAVAGVIAACALLVVSGLVWWHQRGPETVADTAARPEPASPPTAPAGARPAPARPKPPPALAVAPFDPQTAHRHQQAWSEYADTPVQTVNTIDLPLVLVPPGEFEMGSAAAERPGPLPSAGTAQARDALARRILSEGPPHRVRITQPFYAGQSEVTVGQFRNFVEATGYQTDAERDGRGGLVWEAARGQWQPSPQATWRNPGHDQQDDDPVVQVTWQDATAFCAWLCRTEQAAYRLPTEAEWEYACRAGTVTSFYTGERRTDASDQARRGGSPPVISQQVGGPEANAWGLRGLQGNAAEWCQDWWGEDYYQRSPLLDPRGAAFGTERVSRGSDGRSGSADARSARRHAEKPAFCSNAQGFRVVREVWLPDSGVRLIPPEQWFDLLPHLDPKTDIVRGQWEWDDGVLLAPSHSYAILNTRCEPPEAYSLEVEVMRTAQDHVAMPFGLGLVAGQRTCRLMLDVRDGTGTVCGLAQLDFKEAASNPTKSSQFSFTSEHPARVTCTVKPGQIVAEAESQKIVDWTGDFRQLSSDSPWNNGGQRRIWLAKDGGVHRIRRLRIRPLSGVAKVFLPSETQRAEPVKSAVCGPIRATLRLTVEGHRSDVYQACFSPDARSLATTGADMTAIWDPQTGHQRGLVKKHTSHKLVGVAYSADGRWFAHSGVNAGPSWGNGVRLGAASQVDRGSTVGGILPRRLTFAPDGTRLVMVSESRKLYLSLVEQNPGFQEFPGLGGPVLAAAFSRDGLLLASGGTDGAIRLWDPATRQPKATLNGHEGEIWDLAFAPDNQTLASAGSDHTVVLWDLRTGEKRHVLAGHESQVNALAMLDHGFTLVSAGFDGTVALWDVATGRAWGRFVAHQAPIWCVALSADGRLLATGSGDRTIKIWDLAEPSTAGRP